MGTYYPEPQDLLFVYKTLYVFPSLKLIDQLFFVSYMHIRLHFRIWLIILDHLKN